MKRSDLMRMIDERVADGISAALDDLDIEGIAERKAFELLGRMSLNERNGSPIPQPQHRPAAARDPAEVARLTALYTEKVGAMPVQIGGDAPQGQADGLITRSSLLEGAFRSIEPGSIDIGNIAVVAAS